jgi:rare lipoprotein A
VWYLGTMGTISGEHLCRAARFVAVAGACLTLAQCGSASKLTNRLDPKYGVSASPRVVQAGEPVPKGGGTFRVGRPYTVAGRVYVPEEDRGYSAEGLASWYGDDFHGRLTANGEVFDMSSISAAHPTLPMPSYARVTNMRNGKSLIVRVNDRGPFHANRVIDVSYRAASLLEFERSGTARVRVEYVGRASLDGSDDRQLMATLRTNQPAPPPSAVMVASAKPFVPEIASPGRGAIRGDIPVPEGRPYTLGHTSADVASINATSSMSAQRRSQTVAANSYPRAAAHYETGETAPGVRPVSAYAPVQRSFAADPISGRGLY